MIRKIFPTREFAEYYVMLVNIPMGHNNGEYGGVSVYHFILFYFIDDSSLNIARVFALNYCGEISVNVIFSVKKLPI